MKDKRVDAYIAKSREFAQPILCHLRDLVHAACPDVTETIKWGFPHFDYHGIMCNMAAFKEHCSFGFWKAELMKDTSLMRMASSEAAMGHLGQLKTLKDIPPDKVMKAYIREAAQLNEAGIKVQKPASGPKKPLRTPPALSKALKENAKAMACFNSLSYSHRKEYIEWISEAKTDPTRDKRITTTVTWLTEGKSRNWKYAK